MTQTVGIIGRRNALLIEVIENQHNNLKALSALGFGNKQIIWNDPKFDDILCKYLAESQDFDYRCEQAFCGQKMVDGQGAIRVAQFIRELSND